MKKIISTLLLTLLFTVSVFAQQDAEGCKDSPVFPKRVPDYSVSECKSNYGEADFIVAAGGSKTEHKEGTLTMIRYDFYAETGRQKPSALQILKNYENASKIIGGLTVYQNSNEAIGTYKVMKSGKESAWIKVSPLLVTHNS